MYLSFGRIDISFTIAKKRSVGLYFFVLVLVMLFCHICKLNKLYVVKRFCILFKQSLWELIGFVWCEVSDCETEMWIIFFFCKNLPYDKWIPNKQTNKQRWWHKWWLVSMKHPQRSWRIIITLYRIDSPVWFLREGNRWMSL